ncbi:MAG: hypothetical protein A2508_06205 [Candidatus Lambdaproteobacteria bacterium RIFOXYD12_FULL_49_8]|uniref:Protein-glutamate methylesterase/protein-glutamine glutaminase n=1 Tax=Candidatus Lambdaproteobacteria bacterium RIFOXYD2_FULL_50_16 TaxID=1817772 RepID=A0A1F6G6C5_9PROT|nr:MAG: hypothetical protein A2527_11100 [Candidatus Lambdaproteobacteria bacterium RIFOXYD2_FULL_50_16]OGG96423.1 MAG: hypothetical protein A2508_06205 [Candidatus Lambdaproteobacteria bacterium RIFOXYD12_FULL_49_8]
MASNVKIMVVDDTITYRQIMSKVVEMVPGTELVTSAASGRAALMKIPSTKPDLIFLDVMMPDLDGIQTLRLIKQDFPNIHVVMVSGIDKEMAQATLDSLAAGALTFVAKPQGGAMEESLKQLVEALTPLVDLVREMVYGETKETLRVTAPLKPVLSPDKGVGRAIDLILIGISTGGPNALNALFGSIKSKFPCPVLIVQHMPPMFTASLAERLDQISPMSIKEAQEGDRLHPGEVYIAPGGIHMTINKAAGGFRIALNDGPPVNHCKPAVDVLFESVAGLDGVHALSVVMTGMGRDGTEGVKLLKQRGTYCLIQDQATSVVWGMPGSVSEAGIADEVLPLEKIGDRLVQLANQYR